ncbi:MAG: tyrosine-protein phosphatase [Synergistaceae bacterium]|nr:tyrosine-protein phosphatase [Synergistaceae bacterium]
MKRLRVFAGVMLIGLMVCIIWSAECEASSWGKNFYKGLSRRLGYHREDYPALTDEEFANFRMVRVSGIGEGKLYRSSSPVSTWGNRNAIADEAARRAGVRTFVNLADTESSVKAHKGFAGSYYSTQRVIGLGLGMKYQSSALRESLARGIREMAKSEAPYLIHCSLGKDRAGYVCALIECLMGASIQEVTEDYLVSFWNYFGIRKGTREYDYVAENEIIAFLARAFGVKSEQMTEINLAEAAERYFRGIGVSVNEIAALREKLH